MNPLISVIIPTYNRPQLLPQALASIQQQRDVPGGVEVIVVNDGGRDVSGVIRTAREQGLTTRLVELATNRGLPIARNLGISASRGTHLAFLDDDDVFLPDHLATMLHHLGGDRVDAAYGDCLVSGTRVDPTESSYLLAQSGHPFDSDLLAVANFIPVHSAVIRRPTETARFDPQLPALEDWDMWLRLVREHRYRFVHVPSTTVVYHRIPDQNGMCAATTGDTAALAGFGRLVEHLWRRWPATTQASRRFRLYIAVLYWHALARLADGKRLADDYFQSCMYQIAATWHGQQPEDTLPARIIEAMKDGTHVGSSR